MKKFYTYLSLGAAAVFSLTFTGCETTEAGGNGSDAKFSVSVVSTGSDNATAVVTSDSENATWYCFVTEDLDTPAANLAEAEAAKLDNPASVLKKGNGSASFSGLTPSTSYRAIVTGLREDGSVYGTPAEDEFKTDRVIGEIEENADWTMSYGGRVLDQTLAVYDVVKCEAASDDEGYFTMVCPVDEYEYYYSQTGVEGFIKDAMEQYQDIIDQYGGQIGWSDILIYGDTEDQYNVLDGGDWYFFAIGANEDGQYTGYYAMEEVNIPEVTGDAGYLAFAGEWQYETTMTSYDQSGTPAGSEPYTNPLLISPAGTVGKEIDANGLFEDGTGVYVVDGYQGWGTTEPMYPSLTTLYDPTADAMYFMGYDLGYTVSTQYGVAYINFLGTYTYQGESSVIDGIIAEAKTSGNGFTISGIDLYDENDNKVATTEMMEYLGLVQTADGVGILSFAGGSDAPEFPFDVVPYQAQGYSAKAASKANGVMTRIIDTESVQPAFMSAYPVLKSFERR